MRNSKYGTTVRKYSNLHVQYENNDYNRHFRQSAAVFRLKTAVFNLPKAKKYDYFRKNNCGTRKGTPVVFLKNMEIIA